MKSSQKSQSCSRSLYFKKNPAEKGVIHDLTIPGIDCIEIDIRPYYNVQKRPSETVLYPDFKFSDEPLPKPLAKLKLPSSSREGGVEYEVEYYNITPEQISTMAKKGEIKKTLMIHGAHHSVNLFLNHKDESQLAIYCHPLFSMKGEKEYILRYTNKFKYPLAIITMVEPKLPELMASRGVPKIVSDLSSQRWCTREFKQESVWRFKKFYNLNNTTDLKGIQYHQSKEREKRAGWEETVKDDSYCYETENVKDEKGKPILIPAINKFGNPVILKNGKPKMTTQKRNILKDENFKYQSMSPDFWNEEIDNYKTMVKYEIPLNSNCRILDRHGCTFCPFAREQYYDYLKEKRPADYEFCKNIIKWGSTNRIKKYNYLADNLERFSKAISKADMEQILTLFGRDRDWTNAETEFKTQILKQIKGIVSDRIKRYEEKEGKKVTQAKNEAIIREEMINFIDTSEGQKQVYDYLNQKFEKWNKYSKQGLYILFPKRPDLLT